MLGSCGHAARNAATPKPTPSRTSAPTEDPDYGGEFRPFVLHKSSGDIRAEVRYPGSAGIEDEYDGFRIRAWVGTRLVADQVETNKPTDLRIVTLEGGRRAVLVDTFSGGAHCCMGTVVVTPGHRGQRAAVVAIDWGNAYDKLIPSADGSGSVFLGADDSSAYRFSSFAGSKFPIMIFSFRGGRFVDVTNDYPSLIRSDAAQHWHEFRTETYYSPDSALSAYLADEYRLGNEDAAWARVHRANDPDKVFYANVRAWLREASYVNISGGSKRTSPRG